MIDPVRIQHSLEDGVMAGWRWANPGAPLLVFAHANGFNGGVYRQVLQPLSEHFEILAPDLRGHGRTTLPAHPASHHSWNVYARDLLAFYAQLDRTPALLAGHSMGASSTLLAAAQMTDAPPLALVEPVVLPSSLYLMARSPLWRFMKGTVKQGQMARKRSNGWPDADSVIKRYRSRPTFARWADGVLEDYLEDGLTLDVNGVRLSCDPEWEAANFEGQAHDLLKAARRVDGLIQVLKASKASTVINARGLNVAAPGSRPSGAAISPRWSSRKPCPTGSGRPQTGRASDSKRPGVRPAFSRLCSESLLAFFAAGFLALVLKQEALADADAFRGHFDQLVVIDEFKRVFERHADRRGQDHRFVRARGAHVRQLLALERVDDHVLFAGVQAHDHAFIDLDAMADEKLAALLDVPQGEGQSLAGLHGDDRALGTLTHLAGRPRRVVVKRVEHQARALCQGQEFRPEADQAAGRRHVFKTHPAIASGSMFLSSALRDPRRSMTPP